MNRSPRALAAMTGSKATRPAKSSFGERRPMGDSWVLGITRIMRDGQALTAKIIDRWIDTSQTQPTR